MSYKNKIENLVKKLSQDLQEREPAIKLSMLALLSGESIFLLGPPGVAKSLVSRKIKEGIKGASNFEYLMNRFSTPDEIFGPISLKKLEEDKYERKIEGYLPESEIVFLDEIWKASPSIQNTLLTIINEKIYRNGTNTIDVPMLLLIAASNELPAQGEGLEALYDRFIIRLYVNNVSNKDNFLKVIDGTRYKNEKITDKEKLTLDEIKEIKEAAKKIPVDEATFNFICTLKDQLNAKLGESAPYVSDRRWRKIIEIMKTNAVVSDRDHLEPSDWILVQEMIWETQEQYEAVHGIVFDTWMNTVINQEVGASLGNIEKSISKIESDFTSADDEPVTYNVNNNECFGFTSSNNSDVIFVRKSDMNIINNNYVNYFYTNKNKFNKKQKLFTNLGSDSSYNHNSTDVDKIDFDDCEYKIIKEKIFSYSGSANIEDELAYHTVLFADINNKKEKIINQLKKNGGVLTVDYNYYIDKFGIDLDKKMINLSKRRDELIVKFKNAQSDAVSNLVHAIKNNI